MNLEGMLHKKEKVSSTTIPCCLENCQRIVGWDQGAIPLLQVQENERATSIINVERPI